MLRKTATVALKTIAFRLVTGYTVNRKPIVDTLGKQSTGALYDLVAPTKETSEFNQFNKALITIEINGEKIIDLDRTEQDPGRFAEQVPQRAEGSQVRRSRRGGVVLGHEH